MKAAKICTTIRGAADHLWLMKILYMQWKRRFKRTDDSPFRHFPCIFHKFQSLLHKIVPEKRHFRKSCSLWMPMMITNEHKMNKRCGMLSRGAVLFHDNACPHIAAAKQESHRDIWLRTIRSPPYSPDLVPSDFHVFLHPKTFLGGRRFHDDEVKETINTWFVSQVVSFYNAGI
jgi:hypothetical protein